MLTHGDRWGMNNDTEEGLRDRIRDLEAALKQNDPILQTTFRLTPTMANIMGLLMTVPLVTPSMIEQRLEIATEAKVAVHRLRHQLKPFGIEITSKRKLGYWLEAPAKKRIDDMTKLALGVVIAANDSIAVAA